MRARTMIIRGIVAVLVVAMAVGLAVVEPRMMIVYAGISILVAWFFYLTNQISKS
jgi:hypothetical protein